VANEAGLPFTIDKYNDYEHDYGAHSSDEMSCVCDLTGQSVAAFAVDT